MRTVVEKAACSAVLKADKRAEMSVDDSAATLGVLLAVLTAVKWGRGLAVRKAVKKDDERVVMSVAAKVF